MKNIIFKTTALTLIELIFATTLVSVVLVGLFSITSVLSTNSQDYGQKYLLASQTQATLNHILGNAALAVGSASANPAPIVTNAGGDPNSFCIHQGPNNNILSNANEDLWLCYSLSGYQISWCAVNYANSPSSCSAAVAAGHLIGGTTVNFVGTAYGITSPIITDPPAPASSPSYTNPTFSIIIENCLNDSAATCVPDCRYSTAGTCTNGGTTNPVSNPEVVRYGSAATPQVSP